MPICLVTGGAGFVGANLVRKLVADGHEVHCLLRPDSDLWRLRGLCDRFNTVTGTLADTLFVEQTIADVTPDVIFHLAASGAYSFQRDVVAMAATNVLGFANLLRATDIHPDARIVNAGSSSEYGEIDRAPLEGEPPRPNSAYSATKAAATELGVLARRDGKEVITLRLYSVYGPWEEPSRLIPTLCRAALRGDWPPLAGPKVVRDYVYVDDVVELICRSGLGPMPPSAIYNAGSGTEISIAELAKIAANVFGVTKPPEFGSHPGRTWDTAVWKSNPERARRELGWQAATPLDEGLARTGQWITEWEAKTS